MEECFVNNYFDDEYVLLFDMGVGVFGGVVVGVFVDDNVGLFVFDLGEEFGEMMDYDEYFISDMFN